MKKTIKITSRVIKKFWNGPDDEYLSIPIGDIQVSELKEGTYVEVTIVLEAVE